MRNVTPPHWARETELTQPQFTAISDMVKTWSGINLHAGKMALVRSRLGKRLRSLGMDNYGDYVRYVSDDPAGSEKAAMLDAISTNLTHFFREPRHFQHLANAVLPRLIARHKHDRRIRIWSAGCSSGEEPYSIAMVLQEAAADLAGWDLGILATDLSRKMIEIAQEGLYGSQQLRETAPHRAQKYFTYTERHAPRPYRVNASLRQMVHFSRLNLIEPWPMKGPFDVIFCRNVMIYFDKATQQRLIERFWEILAPDGMLFLGHAESLAGVRHRFQYVEPAIYQKFMTERRTQSCDTSWV